MSGQITTSHRERLAFVYVRQSTVAQVRNNAESTNRQYALRERAVSLGWSPESVVVLDEDLGKSGATTEGRSGLSRLAEAVAQGRAGTIFALEMSRLARSSTDWQHLLRLCAVAEVMVADEERIYDPRDPDDRLLLDFKGTMSEAELNWLRLRLAGARLSKARRGEFEIPLPTGYIWGPEGPQLDPDESIQAAIRTVFARFEVEPSINAVVRWALRTGFQMPLRTLRSARSWQQADVEWKPLTLSRLATILNNPVYAGVYAYGRRSSREVIRDGQIAKIYQRNDPDRWLVRLFDSHPGYITWETFVRNQEKLRDNVNRSSFASRGAPREGVALLSGLAICGRCGTRLVINYWGKGQSRFSYHCPGRKIRGGSSCWGAAGHPIDAAVERVFLQAAAPSELELTLAVQARMEQQSEDLTRGWALRLERAEYEARLAERRYKAVDPDNRVVARSLERDWETKLREVERLEKQLEQVWREQGLDLTDEDRARIRQLAANLDAVWRAETTTMTDRKAMLRVPIEAVVLEPIDAVKSSMSIQVQWKTGNVSRLSIPRPKRGEWSATPSEAIRRISDWASEGVRDEEIAERLNEAGIVTGQGKSWNVPAVRWTRRVAGIKQTAPPATRRFPLPDRDPDGRFSVAGAARLFGVGPDVVRGWIRNGKVDAVRADLAQHRRAWWIRIDAADEARLGLLGARARRRAARKTNE